VTATVLTILNRPSLDASAHDVSAAAWEFVDPSLPHVSALDLSATRGDGVFETLSVGDGHPQAFTHHLERFARSARLLDLPAPDLDLWRAAIIATAAELDPVPEAFIKIVLTRGVEGDGRPTGWAYAAPSGDFTADRTTGIRVVMLDRGYRSDIAQTSPWLLGGAKTLSYAINRAAVREAAGRGADDVIFVSSDGLILEGPTSTVLYRRGDTLFSPSPELGILDGTTQVNLFRYAESIGFATAYDRATPETLRSADAVWLVSSVRLAAPVRELDGHPIPVDSALTGKFTDFLRALRD
jgi:4-amino-4-deoxychorismate lyase